MDTNGIETTTFHDRRPTHPSMPEAVLNARRKMNSAWHMHQTACDNLEAGVGDPETVKILLSVATAAALAYGRAWDKANGNGAEPGGVL